MLLDWGEFVKELSAPATVGAIVGFLLSIIIEYVPAYGGLAKKWKRLVYLGLCLAVPLVGAGLGILTLGWAPDWYTVFWPSIVAGFSAWLAGTGLHIKVHGLPEGRNLRNV